MPHRYDHERPPDTQRNPVLHKARGEANACGQVGAHGRPSDARVSDWRDVTCEVCLALEVPRPRRVT